jgi:hypothetical protein
LFPQNHLVQGGCCSNREQRRKTQILFLIVIPLTRPLSAGPAPAVASITRKALAAVFTLPP